MGGVEDETLRRDFLGVLSCFKMRYIIGSMCGDDVTAYHKGVVFWRRVDRLYGYIRLWFSFIEFPRFVKRKVPFPDSSQEIHVVFNLVRERWKSTLTPNPAQPPHTASPSTAPSTSHRSTPECPIPTHQSTYHPVGGLTYLHDLRRC